ncbi:lipopolysaccharide biosynthesis protein [Aquella oligotrophica]|uniref:Polysaccharide biosynthesis protein n=1 Tax=Aquella oligotrophica TaxID=2067065 RepID=A0A2I7N9A3_9NEIS|nr:oligosaccharide flippase family protein [Aquella oligotrophica]AUR53029.1 hypothetical protein CUN60_12245 [Aquella oligotrophica]
MLKQFIQHSSIYTLATFVSRGASFVMLPILTHYLQPQDYGILDLITVLSGFVGLICGLELYQGLARYIPESKSFNEKQVLFSSVITYIIIAYITFSILANLLMPTVTKYIIPISNSLTFNLILLIFLSQAINTYITNLLRFELQQYKTLIVDVSPIIITLILNVIFIIHCKLELTGAIFAILLASLSGNIIGLYFVRDYLTLNIDITKIKKLIYFCFPLLISAVATVVLNFSDRIIIKTNLSLTELGLFGVGYRFANVVTILISGIAASIFPLIYGSMNNPDFRQQFSKLVNKTLPIIILIITVIITYGDEIIRLIVAKEYYSSIPVFRNIAIGLLFSQLYIFTPGLHINKRLTSILIINIASAAINLLLCYYLAKLYGINGVSIATMLSNMILFSLYFILSQQNYKFDYNYITIGFCMISLLLTNTLLGVYQLRTPYRIGYLVTIGICFFIIKHLNGSKSCKCAE